MLQLMLAFSVPLFVWKLFFRTVPEGTFLRFPLPALALVCCFLSYLPLSASSFHKLACGGQNHQPATNSTLPENRAHSVAERRAQSSCCGVELTDEPALPVVPTASAAAGPTLPPVTEDFFHQTAQKDAPTWLKRRLRDVFQEERRIPIIRREYDNSHTLCWSGELVRLSNVSINLQNKRRQQGQ